MSSDCSDDDMPELESVSSSEYVSDDEGDISLDEDMPTTPKWIDPTGEHYKVAKQWLEQDKLAIDRQFNVITVYLLSPFLYGHAHQEDIWLRWCQEAGLLLSDTDYNTDCLTESERHSVDLLDSALQYCRNTMKDRHSPDSLAHLLKLASDVRKERKEGSYKHAIKVARGSSWFMLMIKKFKLNSMPGSVMSLNPVELGCLYVIYQTAEHIVRYVKDGHDFYRDFQDKVQSDEEVGDPLKKSGDDMVKANKYREAIEEYSTAIVCCPYNAKLYTNRALAFMDLKEYKSSLSDGLRAMILDPCFPKGYIRYIVALKACGEIELMQRVSNEYHKRFSSIKDRDLLKKAIDVFPQSEKVEASQENTVTFEMLKRVCKQASESYLNGNNKEAVFYFEEAQTLMKRDKGWKNCLSALEGKKFSISLHFAYGLSLLENGSHKFAELALREFQTIIEEYRNMHFVPAHWGAARALVLLHRHSHALVTARNGLEALPLVKLPPNFTWPGTNKIMSEALLQNVEVNLHKIQESCEPACVPDAICRYGNCSLHHKSSNIKIVSDEYKGHVLLTCSENCSIAYHPTCWRRFKNDSVINSDRDFLLTSCPTPDCAGEVSSVSVFDLRGKCKIKFEPPSIKAPPSSNQAGISQPGKKKTKKSIKTKGSRKKLLSDSVPSDGYQEEGSKMDGESPEGSVKDDGDVINDITPSPVEEDARRFEDIVERIEPRQVEVENKESGKAKGKKKKEKKTLATDQLGFDYQVRSDGTPTEETKSIVPKWVPDEEYPFQPPEHLREALEQFESTEVSSMGLVPRPPNLPVTASDKDDYEFIYSYFREIFKSHGGLLLTDAKLSDALTLLPEDKKGLIDRAGGLVKCLLMSPIFRSHGELICLSEDASVIAASIYSVGNSSGSGLSLDNETEKTPTKKKRSKKAEKCTQMYSQSSTESESVRFDVGSTDKTKTYGEELSSGVNSTANSPILSPRMPSPVLSAKTKSTNSQGSSSSSSVKELLKSESFPHKSKKTKDEIDPKKTTTQSNEDKEYEEMFGSTKRLPHPKRSISNNNVDRGTSKDKLTSEWDKQVAKVKSELVTGGGRIESWEQKPVLSVNLVNVGVTVRPLLTDKWSNTDPIPPVESYKDRYEMALREKYDLQSKLERSEDQRYIMQKDHKRELERVQQQSKAEAKAEYQSKIDELETKVSEERVRIGAEKKEHSEQIRSYKTEIKSLSDKIEKMKKDASKKEKYSENSLIQMRIERDRVDNEKRRLEDRLRSQNDKYQQTLHRAMEAELELLKMRRESVFRPAELRLREVDNILMYLPRENEYFHEWESYKDKLKTSLDCFMNAMEDQVKQLRAGKPLTQLDRVPNPAVQFPQQLASFRMPVRPPFMPMMVRPPGVPPHSLDMPRPPFPYTGPNPPGAMTQPVAVGASGFPPPLSGQASLNDSSPTLSTEIDGPGGTKRVSSFDRIVEKLAPSYPQCSKTDFKMVLREVRRNNGNTLSGLSLDNIASQIMSILDIRSGEAPTPSATTPTTSKPLTAGGVVSGRGKRGRAAGSKGQAASSKKSLPPVAVADPPKISDIEYDNDGWCIICYEDMCEEDSSTLNCGHRFHSECIRSWFNEQSTCPTCRNHSLLPDEYPSLK